ncbi:MAG: hypothetical protein AB7F32_10530 [Victivallaceae bacterium]
MNPGKSLLGSALLALSLATSAADILILGQGDKFENALDAALKKYPLSTEIADSADFSKYRLVIIPPHRRCTEAEAAKLSRYTGALMVMNRENFGPAKPGELKMTLIEDWDTKKEKPDYRFGGDKKGTLLVYQAENSTRFAELSNSFFRDGSLYLEINNLAGKIKPDDQYLCFNALGGADSDLLSVTVTDRDGNQFVTYAPLDRTPRDLTLRFADFIAYDRKVSRNFDFGGLSDNADDMLKGEIVPDPEKGSDLKLKAADISSITIGLSRRHLWWDKGGSLRLGPVFVAAPQKPDARRSGYAARFSVPYSITGIKIPAGAFDPMDGATAVRTSRLMVTPDAAALFSGFRGDRLESDFDAIPDPAPVAGREKDDKRFVQTVRARSERRIPLLTNRQGQAAAMIVLPADELNLSPPRALFGLPEEAYWDKIYLFDLAAAAADYLINRPQLVNMVPNVHDNRLTAKVYIRNPRTAKVEGNVSMSLGQLTPAAAAFGLEAGQTGAVNLTLPEIPDDFDFRFFFWNITLNSSAGNDFWRDQVDVKATVNYLVDHLLKLQETHADGRFSHHYFSDIYGARAFAVIGQKENRPELVRQAQRLVNGIVSRQTPEGGLPMGYGEQRRICWVADNGTAMIGILEFAAMFPELRREYLAAAKRYYDWRETFYMDDERVAKLEKEFGKNPKLINRGFYGIGYNDGLFYTKGKLKETVRVERGEAWVNGISMVSLPLYYQMTGDRTILEIARRNLREYLPHMDKVNYFGAESLFQMHRLMPDRESADIAEKHLRDAYLSYIFDEDDDYLVFDKGGRRSLDVATAIYCRNNGIENSPRMRAYLVKNLLIHCSPTLPLSVWRVGESYRHSTHGSSIAAARYAGTLSLFWLTEILYPNSTLIKLDECVDLKRKE